MRYGLLCLLAVLGISGCGSGVLSGSNALTVAVPTVSRVTPAASATGVPVNAVVTANFSQAMSAASLATTTLTLTGANAGTVVGAINYNASGTAVTFTPGVPLGYNTQYIANLSIGGTGGSGATGTASSSWSFTTEKGPAPNVIDSRPANGSTGVSLDAIVTATFSDAMQASTITASAFTLTGPSLTPISGAISYSSSSRTATFTPATLLDANTTFTATLTTSATGANGTSMAANYSWSFMTGPPTDLATVDFATSYQTIRGFGGSNAWLGQFTPQQAAALFNPTSGLGLSILRVRIDPSGSATDHWIPSNGGWATELANATEAIAANPNAIAFASPWTPPPSMKISSATQPYYNGTGVCEPGAGYCGGYLDPANYAAYSTYLEDFVNYFQHGGVGLYGISLQNEPDFSNEPGENYESCSWTPQQMEDWIDGNASALTSKLILPESANFDFAEASPALSDPTAASLVSIVAGHLYGTAPSYDAQAASAGKEVWMTEHYLTPSGAQPTIADALQLAAEVHNSMVTGQYSAYVWWSIRSAAIAHINYGLIDEDANNPAPTYYGYALGQFARFIQPGYARDLATANPSPNVLVSAYSGVESGTRHYVIVAINSGSTAVSQSFSLTSDAISSLAPYQTTAAGGLTQGSPVNVTRGNFTFILPAQSVTTLVQ